MGKGPGSLSTEYAQMNLQVILRTSFYASRPRHFSLVENCYSTLKSALSLDIEKAFVGHGNHANRIPRGSRVLLNGAFICAVRIEPDPPCSRQCHDPTQISR